MWQIIIMKLMFMVLQKLEKTPPVNYNDVVNILQQLFSQSGG